MPAVSLVFNLQGAPITGGPVRLVFGEAGGLPPGGVLAEGGGRISGLRGHVRLHVAVRAAAVGRISGLRMAMPARWDANVSRGGLRGELRAAWQEATPVASGLQAAWQQAEPVRVASVARWQEAERLAGGVVDAWQEAERLRAAISSAWQEARPAHGAVGMHWQEAVRLRAAAATRWQEGRPVRGAVDVHWQEAVRLRAAISSAWQEALGARSLLRTGYGDAERLRVSLVPHWQEAMRPRPGVSVLVPHVRPPCYVPELPVRMVFRSTPDRRLPVRLVFSCDGHGNDDNPREPIVVPALRSYIVINSIEIRRADALAGDPLPSESFQMALNRQSWTWTFSATFHASARDALAPGPGGQPVELEVRVNGQPFRMQAERIGRSRRFPEHLVTASGRGLAAVLDAPHAPVQTFSQPLARTAQQLMTEALTVNGVGFGWAVDFQLADWLVPGGVWMHQGTWASALAQIARATGGYLQPHDTDPVLRVLPAWPMPWWDWASGLAYDFDLPAGIGEVDETEVIDQPGYNRIFVSGEAGGIVADLTRSGTAGDVLKQPMAVHPLITTIDAAKALARAELAESGRALKHKMTLPVLEQTGVIKPGHVLRYYDDAGTRRLGIVRATGVSQQFPVLTQSLEIDSHADA